MPRFSRRTKIILLFAAIVIVGYVVTLAWADRNQVPQSFTDARLQGAIIAQNIVNLSNQSAADLEKVNAYDQQGNYTEALNLTTNMLTQSEDLRNQAIKLSAQIEQMTRALSDISSFDARQAALESISSRLALINQLVNYSGDLGNLVDALRGRFMGKPLDGQHLQALVNQVNTDVSAINNFNKQAGQAMDQFDKIVNK